MTYANYTYILIYIKIKDLMVQARVHNMNSWYKSPRVHTNPHIHTYTHTYTRIHTCMHTYIHTYMHACAHTHIHTHACRSDFGTPEIWPNIFSVIVNVVYWFSLFLILETMKAYNQHISTRLTIMVVWPKAWARKLSSAYKSSYSTV